VANPATPLRFNLAHSAGLVLCAVACGRDVGVDVEDLRRRPVDPAVVRRYCSPAEIADIESQRDSWHDRFLRYWTLKEAYLKARGLGVAMPLAEISFTLDGDRATIAFLGSLAGTDARWGFFMAQPTDRHVVALAAATEDGVVPACSVRPMPPEFLA
jgi:4'-phosphopantetheinyl transferase